MVINLAVQLTPQLIPAGELVTVPLPAPARLTVSVYVAIVNVAVTERAWSIVTVQPPVPEQAPLQPPKTEPTDGVAVSVTTVP